MNNEIISRGAATALVQPEGDLVAVKVPALRAQLRDMVSEGVLHMTMDLAKTVLVDSAGIGLLISTHNSLKRAGGELTVVHASNDVLELFRTMRIHRHFNVSGN